MKAHDALLTSTRSPIAVLCSLLAGFLVCSLSTAWAATVTTDKPDYPPGSTAIITGTGFQPGEIVQCQVLRIDINENSGPERRSPMPTPPMVMGQ